MSGKTIQAAPAAAFSDYPQNTAGQSYCSAGRSWALLPLQCLVFAIEAARASVRIGGVRLQK
jgi:hypothetical protein